MAYLRIYCAYFAYSVYFDRYFKSLLFIIWISQKNKNDRWSNSYHFNSDTRWYLNFPPSSFAAKGTRTLVASTASVSPYQLGYRFLGDSYSIIALYPSWGPSCSRTTTCNCLCRPYLFRKKRLESRLLPFASCSVSSLYCQQEQEATFPVWRTLESHTRLALIHGARIRWWTDTHPTKLRKDQIKS